MKYTVILYSNFENYDELVWHDSKSCTTGQNNFFQNISWMQLSQKSTNTCLLSLFQSCQQFSFVFNLNDVGFITLKSILLWLLYWWSKCHCFSIVYCCCCICNYMYIWGFDNFFLNLTIVWAEFCSRLHSLAACFKTANSTSRQASQAMERKNL